MVSVSSTSGIIFVGAPKVMGSGGGGGNGGIPMVVGGPLSASAST